MILKDPKDLLQWFDEYSWDPSYICFSLSDFYQAINGSPAIEAEPVRHGKFVKATPISEPYCDQCGKSLKIMLGLLPNYCPNCGAKMDLEGE